MCEGWDIDIFRFQKTVGTKATKNGFVTEIQGSTLQIFKRTWSTSVSTPVVFAWFNGTFAYSVHDKLLDTSAL